MKRTRLKRKPMRRNSSKVNHDQMKNFFISIWNERKNHRCANCNAFLGNEPRTYMFDHILEKGMSKYKHLVLEKDNIHYLCLHCHDEKTRGILSPYMLQKEKDTLKKFNLEK